jgi:hypothetical protein
MEFRQIDLKTGQELPLPAKNVEHSYLELKIGKDIEPSKLAVGKMYDGITERDIERLQEQGVLNWNKSTVKTDEIKLIKVVFPVPFKPIKIVTSSLNFAVAVVRPQKPLTSTSLIIIVLWVVYFIAY